MMPSSPADVQGGEVLARVGELGHSARGLYDRLSCPSDDG